MLTIFVTVIVIMARMKAKLQTELRQVKSKSNVLYDEIGLPPLIDTSIAKNIAYDNVKT